ncbi:hypothetical protein J6590_064202 [Homalodisca vitripennis]|nr:hypothetical protein J6590_064202 [Homalodisca vitripennis]
MDSFFLTLDEPSGSGEGCSSWQQHIGSDRAPDSGNGDQETSVDEPERFEVRSDNELNNVDAVLQVSDIIVSQKKLDKSLLNLMNGETISSGYFVYSKSTGSVFCASCRLFGSHQAGSILPREGVSD